MKPIKVLYVASIGRSGSTLLNLILGSARECWSVGELKYLKQFINREITDRNLPKEFNYTCDCGNTLETCSFWGDIIAQIKTENLYNKRHSLLYHIFDSKEQQKEEKRLYSLILQQAHNVKGNCEIIVDSSKDLKRLRFLRSIPGVSIQVLHIIRDGRGVINSHEKSGMSTIATFINWIKGNIMMWGYINKTFKDEQIYCLSYDRFAQDPKQFLREINQKFDISINTDDPITAVNQEQFHNFAGNFMRKKKIKEIYYDQSWKRRMPKWKQWILTVLCYIPNKLWVYR